MSTDGSIPQPKNPLATLSSLPIEIKTLIVYYSFLQDESYQDRRNSGNSSVGELTDDDIMEENVYRGRSLASLFQVDTQFSQLCSIYLFKNLRSQDVSSYAFKFTILPRRFHLFRTVNFRKLTLEANADVLAASVHLTNIVEIIITGDSYKLMFDSSLDSASISTQEDLRQGFRILGKNINSLMLKRFTVKDAISCLDLFPNLKSFSFNEGNSTYSGPDRIAEKQSDLAKLGKLLAGYRFEHLKLDFRGNGTWVGKWSGLDWCSCSTLRSIEITLPQFGRSLINFVAIFSTQLKFFTLASNSIVAGSLIMDSSYTLPTTFPLLEHLSFNMATSSWTRMISLFSLSPVTQLQINIDEQDSPDLLPEDSTICSFVTHFPSLRKLIIYDRIIRPNSLPILVQLCTQSHILLEFQLFLHHSPDALKFEDTQLHSQHRLAYQLPILAKALQYGERKLLRLEKEKDLEGMQEMWDKCIWLRANAAEMMD